MSTKATIEWIKNHAGLWTFGIFVIAVLGVVGALGAWALEGQKKAVLAIVEQKEATLKGEIDSTREILERLEKKVDDVNTRVDAGFNRMDTRIDAILQAILNKQTAPVAKKSSGKLDVESHAVQKK